MKRMPVVIGFAHAAETGDKLIRRPGGVTGTVPGIFHGRISIPSWEISTPACLTARRSREFFCKMGLVLLM
jgi:hypothetical protein